MKRRDRLFVGLIVVALTAASCGYRFAGGEPLPGGIRRIFVPMAQNRTAESGMEIVVTNALRREIVRRGLALSAGRAGAEAALSTTVVRASGDTITRQTTVTALEREAVLTAAVIFSAGDGSRSLRVTASETYVVTPDPGAADRQRRRALEQAAERLAQKVLSHLASDF